MNWSFENDPYYKLGSNRLTDEWGKATIFYIKIKHVHIFTWKVTRTKLWMIKYYKST